jgi:glycosyltransferase involved in cell wall biosynthesis
MAGQLRVLSVYEGFFSGGARVLHSSVVAGLHTAGSQLHSVLSINRSMRRESILQRMEDDNCYRFLRSAGVPITALNRSFDGEAARSSRPAPFRASELATAARHTARADLVVTLKEQPLRLLNHPDMPRRPVVVCLHRSDPENQGAALVELKTAVADGRIAAAICCAESTRDAYERAGVPGDLLRVIPNGVDLSRFHPVALRRRAQLRRSIGVPARAKVVAFAARYDGMKNVGLFLRSARAFLKHDSHAHVVLCGAGMSTANAAMCHDLETTFADEPRLLNRVHLLGVRHDMESIYASADVVALTSSHGEAAPLCLIEGAMCGAVPVATDIGDCASIVDGLGFIVPADADAIAARWAEAIGRRRELLPALVAARERFSHTRMIANYSTLLERVPLNV